MGGFEEVESRAEVVVVGDEGFEDEVEVFGERGEVELEDGGEGFEGLAWEVGVCVEADDVGEEGRLEGVVVVVGMEEAVH